MADAVEKYIHTYSIVAFDYFVENKKLTSQNKKQ